MRLLIISIVVLIGAIFLGLEIQKDPGTILIRFNEWSIEASLALAAVALLLAFAALYILVRLIGKVWRSPRDFRKYQNQRKEHKAYSALHQGLLQFTQGNWGQAQKLLSKTLEHKNTSTLGYLTSARAAQHLGNTETRDRFLQLASQSSQGSDITVGITESQLLIENQQLEQAAHKLRQLHQTQPKNKMILQLLKTCYLEAHAWDDLAALMPTLEKAKIVSPEEALHMERDVYGQLFAKATLMSEDTKPLDATWRDVPHALRRDKHMLAMYVRYLIEHGEGIRPESILRHRIRNQWDDDLVYLYGLVDSGNPPQQLSIAERWLRRYSDNATLLLTLGRLALRNHLWAKARTYLEQSADISPRPETYMLLGKLLEQTGEKIIAGECFRKGLGISVSKDIPPIERTAIESKDDKKKEKEKDKDSISQALATVSVAQVPATALASGAT